MALARTRRWHRDDRVGTLAAEDDGKHSGRDQALGIGGGKDATDSGTSSIHGYAIPDV
jgi:hypothetical protein